MIPEVDMIKENGNNLYKKVTIKTKQNLWIDATQQLNISNTIERAN